MSDITFCINSACPQCKQCYKFMAVPKLQGSFASFDPENDDCFLEL